LATLEGDELAAADVAGPAIAERFARSRVDERLACIVKDAVKGQARLAQALADSVSFLAATGLLVALGAGAEAALAGPAPSGNGQYAPAAAAIRPAGSEWLSHGELGLVTVKVDFAHAEGKAGDVAQVDELADELPFELTASVDGEHSLDRPE
jgi:hypothetical protein